MKRTAFFIAILIPALLQAQVPIIDYSFQAVPPTTHVNRVVELPDGRILLAGAFQNYAGSGKNNLVRLHNDGTVDASFNPGGSGPSNQVHDLAVMDDGRIIIGGVFNSYNGQPSGFVARLHADGTRDWSFQLPPNTINNAVLAVEVHVDDKVLAAGEFNICQGHSQPHITRFNYDGTLDTTFNIGSGFNMPVYDLLVMPDMGVLCTGGFSDYDGNACGRIALLTPEGPFDPSLNASPGLTGTGSTGLTLERQPDGKLLVGGRFTHHQGVARGGISRFTMDGTLDPTFASPFYPYAEVRAIATDVDGRLYVGGSFTSTMYILGTGTGPNRFLRLHPDGGRDDLYPVAEGVLPGAGITAYVNDIHVQMDRLVLVGGRFQLFDTEDAYQQVVRLKEQFHTGMAEAAEATVVHGHWDLATGQLHLYTALEAANAHLLVHAANGKLVTQRQVMPGRPLAMPGGHAPGIYLVRLVQEGRVRTGRVLAR